MVLLENDDLSYINLIANSYYSRYTKFLTSEYGETYKTVSLSNQAMYFSTLITTVGNNLGDTAIFNEAVANFKGISYQNQTGNGFTDDDVLNMINYGINYVTTFVEDTISVEASSYDRFVAQMRSYLTKTSLNLTDEQIEKITEIFAANVAQLGVGSSAIAGLQETFEKSLEDINNDPDNVYGLLLNRDQLDDIEVMSNTLMMDMSAQSFYNLYIQMLTKFNKTELSEMFSVYKADDVIDNNILKDVVYNIDAYRRKKLKKGDIIQIDDGTFGVVIGKDDDGNNIVLDETGNEREAEGQPTGNNADTGDYSKAKADLMDAIAETRYVYSRRTLLYSLVFKRGTSKYSFDTKPTVLRCSFNNKDLPSDRNMWYKYGICYTTAYNVRGDKMLTPEEGVVYKHVTHDSSGTEEIMGYYEYNRNNDHLYTKITNLELALGPYDSSVYAISKDVNDANEYQKYGFTYKGNAAAIHFKEHPMVVRDREDWEGIADENPIGNFKNTTITVEMADNTINNIKPVTISHDRKYAYDEDGEIIPDTKLNTNTIYQDSVDLFDATDRYFRYDTTEKLLKTFDYQEPVDCALHLTPVDLCPSHGLNANKTIAYDYKDNEIDMNRYRYIQIPGIMDVDEDQGHIYDMNGDEIHAVTNFYYRVTKEDKIEHFKYEPSSHALVLEPHIEDVDFKFYEQKMTSTASGTVRSWTEISDVTYDIINSGTGIIKPYIAPPEAIPQTSCFSDDLRIAYDIDGNEIYSESGDYISTPLFTEVNFIDNDFTVAYDLKGNAITADYSKYKGYFFTNNKGNKTYYYIPDNTAHTFMEYPTVPITTYYQYTPIVEGSTDCTWVPKNPWVEPDEEHIYVNSVNYGDADDMLYRWIAKENTTDGVGYFAPFNDDSIEDIFLVNDASTTHEGYELGFNLEDNTPVYPLPTTLYRLNGSIPAKTEHLYYHWVPYFGQYQPIGTSINKTSDGVVRGFIDSSGERYVKANGKEVETFSTFKLYMNDGYNYQKVMDGDTYWIWQTSSFPSKEEYPGEQWDEFFNDKSNWVYYRVNISYHTSEADGGPIQVTFGSSKTVATGTDENKTKYRKNASASTKEKMLKRIFFTGGRKSGDDRKYYYWNTQEETFKRIYIVEGKRTKCFMIRYKPDDTKSTTKAYVAITGDRTIIKAETGQIYVDSLSKYYKKKGESEKLLAFFWNRKPIYRIGKLSPDKSKATPQIYYISHISKNNKVAYGIDGSTVKVPDSKDKNTLYIVTRDRYNPNIILDKPLYYRFDYKTLTWFNAYSSLLSIDAVTEKVTEQYMSQVVINDRDNNGTELYYVDKATMIYKLSEDLTTAYTITGPGKYNDYKYIEVPASDNQLYYFGIRDTYYRYRKYWIKSSSGMLVIDDAYLEDNNKKYNPNTMVYYSDVLEYLSPDETATIKVGDHVKKDTNGKYFIQLVKLDELKKEHLTFYKYSATNKVFESTNQYKEGNFVAIDGKIEDSVPASAISTVSVMSSPNPDATGETDEYYAFTSSATGPTLVNPSQNIVYYDNAPEITPVSTDNGKNFVWDTLGYTRIDPSEQQSANIDTDTYLHAYNENGIEIKSPAGIVFINNLPGGDLPQYGITKDKYYIFDDTDMSRTNNFGYTEFDYNDTTRVHDININDDSFQYASIADSETSSDVSLVNPKRIYVSAYNSSIYYKYKLDASEAGLITEGMTYGLYPNGTSIDVKQGVETRKLYYMPVWEPSTDDAKNSYFVTTVSIVSSGSGSFDPNTMRYRDYCWFADGSQPAYGSYIKQTDQFKCYRWNGYKFIETDPEYRYVRYVPEKDDPVVINSISDDLTKAYDETGAVITPTLYDIYYNKTTESIVVYDDGYIDYDESEKPTVTPLYKDLDLFVQPIIGDGYLSGYDKNGDELSSYGEETIVTNGVSITRSVIYKDSLSDGTSDVCYLWNATTHEFEKTTIDRLADGTVEIPFTVTYYNRPVDPSKIKCIGCAYN